MLINSAGARLLNAQNTIADADGCEPDTDILNQPHHSVVVILHAECCITSKELSLTTTTTILLQWLLSCIVLFNH